MACAKFAKTVNNGDGADDALIKRANQPRRTNFLLELKEST
jgi:hypothetical protein